jgi:hypothetical protein
VIGGEPELAGSRTREHILTSRDRLLGHSQGAPSAGAVPKLGI